MFAFDLELSSDNKCLPVWDMQSLDKKEVCGDKPFDGSNLYYALFDPSVLYQESISAFTGDPNRWRLQRKLLFKIPLQR